MADEIDGAIGEGSSFHDHYGFYKDVLLERLAATEVDDDRRALALKRIALQHRRGE